MAKTVLIVEDNELNMKLFRDLLEAHGYQTSGTSNGFEALDLVRKLRPDLILMDIQLPGMDGLAAITQLRQDDATRTIPVIALTALAMKGDEERIRAGGFDGYIGKPMRYKEFLAAVQAQVSAH
jgi:two-component system, cell cycle response regulator DivK